ncbi:MAG TPA: lanthionine synthetase LanC family protein [Polyangiaceae bacterium]
MIDAGICHGSAGLALMFGRLHRETGDARFDEAARAWIARILDLRALLLSAGGDGARAARRPRRPG